MPLNGEKGNEKRENYLCIITLTMMMITLSFVMDEVKCTGELKE